MTVFIHIATFFCKKQFFYEDILSISTYRRYIIYDVRICSLQSREQVIILKTKAK